MKVSGVRKGRIKGVHPFAAVLNDWATESEKKQNFSQGIIKIYDNFPGITLVLNPNRSKGWSERVKCRVQKARFRPEGGLL
jgi:hypothetical protein